jgi:hypothetical protein
MPFSLRFYNILKLQRMPRSPSLSYHAFAKNCHLSLQTFYSDLYFFVHLSSVNTKTGKMKKYGVKNRSWPIL